MSTQANPPPPAVDADRKTVHIRCGHDIREALVMAGLGGDFLAYTNPYCQGPVGLQAEFQEKRAEFIAAHYGGDATTVLKRLYAEEDAVKAVSQRYERVILWFEHDSYDQLILAWLLVLLGEHPPAELSLVCIDRFEGVEPFHGLGQLSPQQLLQLWHERTPVDTKQLMLGKTVWKALCDHTPEFLHALAASGTPALPPMAAALMRHLAELPDRASGLSLTQSFCLQALEAGPLAAGRVFARVQRHLEPLPFLGDTMFWPVLDSLCATAAPALTVHTDLTGVPSHERVYELTDAGRAYLAGERDWMAASPAIRWVGGVKLDSAKCWRWDAASSTPLAPN